MEATNWIGLEMHIAWSLKENEINPVNEKIGRIGRASPGLK